MEEKILGTVKIIRKDNFATIILNRPEKLKLKDIVKPWFLNKINSEAVLVKINNYNIDEQYNIRSTTKAVLVNTSDGEIWLPLSAINFNYTSGRQNYDVETGTRYYESYDGIWFSVRTEMNYIR